MNDIYVTNDAETIFKIITAVLEKKYGFDNLNVYGLDDNGEFLFQTKYIYGKIDFYCIGENEQFILSLACAEDFDKWSNSTVIFEKFDSADKLVKFLENSDNVYYRLFIRMSDEYKDCTDHCPYNSLEKRITPYGNLIDADALKKEIANALDEFANVVIPNIIKDAPIIISSNRKQ